MEDSPFEEVGVPPAPVDPVGVPVAEAPPAPAEPAAPAPAPPPEGPLARLDALYGQLRGVLLKFQEHRQFAEQARGDLHEQIGKAIAAIGTLGA